MGCWCETCGVTQLPINAGDKVRLFVLVGQGESWRGNGFGGGGSCYPDEVWAPIGPGIQGEYDDYGGIENIVEDEVAKMVESKIAEGWVPLTKEHDWDRIPEKLGLADYLHFIERGRGATTAELQGARPLGYMMVHEDVYQAMINFDAIEAHHYWNDPDGKRRPFEYMPFSNSLRLEFIEYYERQLSLAKELAAEQDDKMRDLMAFRLELNDRLFSGYRDTSLRPYKNQLQMLAKEQMPLESERVQQVIANALGHMRFQIAMSRARKQWMPQSGKGSQQNGLDIYKAIQVGINKVIETRETYEREELGNEPVDAEGYTSWQREHNTKRLQEKE